MAGGAVAPGPAPAPYVSPGLSPAAMDLLWGASATGVHVPPEAAALRATKVGARVVLWLLVLGFCMSYCQVMFSMSAPRETT